MKNVAHFLALSLPLLCVTFRTSSLLHAQTVTPASTSVSFGSINVCPAGKTTPTPCNSTHTLSFNVTAGTTIGSVAILTTGIPDLDFKAKADDTSATLCKAQTYSPATTCTVDVTFAPLAPGARNGAVELLDGSTVLAMTYVYGTGVGPQIAFSPSLKRTLAQLPLGPGFNYVRPIAVDASGNVFIADYGNNTLKEFVAATGTVKTLLSDTPFNQSSTAMAVDGAGNIFVLSQAIDEFVAADDYATVKVFNPGFTPCCGLAIDGSGNFFSDDYNTGEIKEIFAASGYTTVKVLANGSPYSGRPLAIDAEDNVYVGNEKILAAGDYTTVETLGGSGHFEAIVIAVDAAENVYILGDVGGDSNGVYEIMAAGGYSTINKVSANFNEPYTLGIDAAGDLYVIDRDEELKEVLRSQPPAFAFEPTVVGTTSSDSPKSATVQNIGNATLTGSELSLIDATDFKLVAGSGTPPDCTFNFSLAPSAECNLSIDFIPESVGALTGSVVLTDDSGNVTGATQSIALSGTGVPVVAQISPTILQFGSIPYPGSATQTLTITNIATGTLVVDPSSNGRGAIITGNTCGAGIGAGKSCTLQVEFDPTHLGLNTNTLTIATNAGTSPEVPVRGTATGVGSLNTVLDFGTVRGRGNTSTLPLTVTNYGVSGTVTVATETGATSFKATSNGCTAGITAGNSCMIEVQFAPIQANLFQTGYIKLIPSTGSEQIIVMQGTLVP